MGQPERKTGQHIDSLKSNLINPLLTDLINDINDLPEIASLLDVGSGDASNVENLILQLAITGKLFNNIGLLESDREIFEGMSKTILGGVLTNINLQLLLASNNDVINKFLEVMDSKYDIAVSQLVLHQIKNFHEASFLMFVASYALKQTGNLFVVNLHPAYLNFLSQHYPEKFETLEITDDFTRGMYHFDEGGANEVFSRKRANYLAMFLSLGFDLIDDVPIIVPQSTSNSKRIQELAELQIPMFYVFHLKSNPTHFRSATIGTVDRISDQNDGWINVSFLDHYDILIPAFSWWQDVQQNDQLYLQEVRRTDFAKNFLNFWTISQTEKIRGGQLMINAE